MNSMTSKFWEKITEKSLENAWSKEDRVWDKIVSKQKIRRSHSTNTKTSVKQIVGKQV